MLLHLYDFVDTIIFQIKVSHKISQEKIPINPWNNFVFQSQNQRKGLLEIGEEEELTHYGQSLADIEKFEDPIDDSDLEEDGRISGK